MKGGGEEEEGRCHLRARVRSELYDDSIGDHIQALMIADYTYHFMRILMSLTKESLR